MIAVSPSSKSRQGTMPLLQIQRIQEALRPLGSLAGVSIWHKSAAGNTAHVLRDGMRVSGAAEAGHLPLAQATLVTDSGDEFFIGAETGDISLLPAVEAVLRATLEVLEVEKREELLLDELGASWESLEALYEISTDMLRSGNIKDALERLIWRFVSIQDGLRAALFVTRKGRLEPLVSTGPDVESVGFAQLGQIGKVMSERQVVTLNQFTLMADPNTSWKAATRLAAAPITSGQHSIGFIAVWREDERFEFDSAFLRLLEAITYQASMLMESDRLSRKVRDSELLAKEIEIASSIQQTLLLANAPANVPGMDIAACSVPSQHIDGDFHDFLQHPNGTVDVMVGDVMGKGVAAALLGAATKNQLLRSIANLALRSREGAPRPVDIVLRAAGRLQEELLRLERFVTLCYARFDSTNRRLHFVDCGHTATLLNRKANSECIVLQGDDLPLGVSRNSGYEEHSIAFQPADTFLFYSDGVTENRSPEGEFFGTERLADCLQNWSSLGPHIMVEQIRKEAQRFNRSDRFSDDFTCIAVRIRIAPPNQKPVAVRARTFLCDSRELGDFRAWLAQTAALGERPLGEDEVSRMELACTELFANCASHAHRASFTGPISVESTVYPDHVTVQMRHKGPAFDPLSVPPPCFDGSKDSGFGTYIVLRSADEATYEHEPDGTNVTTVSFRRTVNEG